MSSRQLRATAISIHCSIVGRLPRARLAGAAAAIVVSLWAASASARPVGRPPLPGNPCSTRAKAKVVTPGVAYYDCSNRIPPVHVVTVNRAMPGLQIKLLTRPTGKGSELHLETVRKHAERASAIAAINGYFWEGDEGTWEAGEGTPKTTTWVDGVRKTRNTTGTTEILMGFRAAPTGVQAKLIVPEDLGRPENKNFTQALYGSNSSVMKGGKCREVDDDSSWKSVVGYSRSHIVFLTTVSRSHQRKLCGTLEKFGVIDAVLNDGGPSVSMQVGGSVNKRIIPTRPIVRRVAYAIGVVRAPKPPPPRPKPTANDVECFVFDDNHHRMAGPSDAIFFKGHHAACIPDGKSGTCRKWFGRCRTRGSHEPVSFQAFNDQHRSPTRRADAVYARGQRAACVPDGTRTGACRKWFGAPRTRSARPVTCSLFGENYSQMTAPTTEMYVRGPSQVCRPNGTPTGECRKWFGRCRAR